MTYALVYFYLKEYYIYSFAVLKTGVVSQAQGSAYIEQDGTKVICAV